MGTADMRHANCHLCCWRTAMPAASTAQSELPVHLDAVVVALAATQFAAGVAMLSFAITHGLTAASATRASAGASFVALPGMMLLLAGTLTLFRHPLAWRVATMTLKIAAA